MPPDRAQVGIEPGHFAGAPLGAADVPEAPHRVFPLRFDAETRAVVTMKDAESTTQAMKLRQDERARFEEAMAEIERKTAQSLSEADALKLTAMQPQLVGALQSAADSEVMKAAANNMNLVALLGGKSPAELFEQLLRGTPLSRSVAAMKARAVGDEVKPVEEKPED